MNSDAPFRREPAIRFECLLPGPVDRVWNLLVDTKQISDWYGDGTIEPRVGGAVILMGGHIRGVVTQWQPLRRLSYTWNVFNPDQDESDYPESYLTFELQAKGDDVLLTLTHLPILERFEKQNAMGWHTFLDMLTATVQGETLEPRAEYMKRNASRYGIDLSSLVK